jgi:hypothetical protein
VVDRSAERTYDPVEFVRSWYYLGKLREARGDTVGAREALRRFVSYWKDGMLDHDHVVEAQTKIRGPQCLLNISWTSFRKAAWLARRL